MRRLIVAVFATLACSSAALAQTATPANYIVGAGGTTNFTLAGSAGQQYAVIASTTNSGFAYAGVALAVGTDVQILSIGALDGAGRATVPVTPPFPQRDRYYVQAVFTTDGFASITPSNSVVLLNNQEARVYMPIGGVVGATGTLLFGSPNVTVTKTGAGVYRVDYPGLFNIPAVIPSITPINNATVVALSVNPNTMTVTLSGDAGFYFTVQAIGR